MDQYSLGTTTARERMLGMNITVCSEWFMRIFCHIFHRSDWEYVGSRQDDAAGPWPIDAYRCGRCERAWERVS
jgi:hypothetical protein